ncbi:MAG: hypothetical protein U1C55_12540, partial [Smithellaceae bacterium]|nr:hypothetical protein [Smithellaceae bacterium]
EIHSLAYEDAAKILRQLRSMGVRMVVFEGGEPLLWRDGKHTISDLIEEAKQLFFSVAVTTNGTIPLDVPADIIWVSIDGLDGSQDRLRSDSRQAVWDNLGKTNHARVFVHFTLNRENWRELEPLTDRLCSLPAFKGLTVQLFYPYRQGETPLTLANPERQMAIDEVIRLKKRGAPILNSIGVLRKMIENRWTCHEDILVNIDPDGTITQGCYALSRGSASYCDECGFTPVAEASGAVDLNPGSLLAGWRIFVK